MSFYVSQPILNSSNTSLPQQHPSQPTPNANPWPAAPLDHLSLQENDLPLQQIKPLHRQSVNSTPSYPTPSYHPLSSVEQPTSDFSPYADPQVEADHLALKSSRLDSDPSLPHRQPIPATPLDLPANPPGHLRPSPKFRDAWEPSATPLPASSVPPVLPNAFEIPNEIKPHPFTEHVAQDKPDIPLGPGVYIQRLISLNTEQQNNAGRKSLEKFWKPLIYSYFASDARIHIDLKCQNTNRHRSVKLPVGALPGLWKAKYDAGVVEERMLLEDPSEVTPMNGPVTVDCPKTVTVTSYMKSTVVANGHLRVGFNSQKMIVSWEYTSLDHQELFSRASLSTGSIPPPACSEFGIPSSVVRLMYNAENFNDLSEKMSDTIDKLLTDAKIVPNPGNGIDASQPVTNQHHESTSHENHSDEDPVLLSRGHSNLSHLNQPLSNQVYPVQNRLGQTVHNLALPTQPDISPPRPIPSHSDHTLRNPPNSNQAHRDRTNSRQGHLDQTRLEQGHLNQGYFSQDHFNQSHFGPDHFGPDHFGPDRFVPDPCSQGHPSQAQLNHAQLSQAQLNQGHLSLDHLNQGHLNQTHRNQINRSQTQSRSKQVHPNQVNPSQTHPKRAKLNQPHPSRGIPNKAHPKQVKPDQENLEQTKSSQAHPNQRNPNQANSNQPHSKDSRVTPSHVSEAQANQAFVNLSHLKQSHASQAFANQDVAKQNVAKQGIVSQSNVRDRKSADNMPSILKDQNSGRAYRTLLSHLGGGGVEGLHMNEALVNNSRTVLSVPRRAASSRQTVSNSNNVTSKLVASNSEKSPESLGDGVSSWRTDRGEGVEIFPNMFEESVRSPFVHGKRGGNHQSRLPSHSNSGVGRNVSSSLADGQMRQRSLSAIEAVAAAASGQDGWGAASERPEKTGAGKASVNSKDGNIQVLDSSRERNMLLRRDDHIGIEQNSSSRQRSPPELLGFSSGGEVAGHVADGKGKVRRKKGDTLQSAASSGAQVSKKGGVQDFNLGRSFKGMAGEKANRRSSGEGQANGADGDGMDLKCTGKDVSDKIGNASLKKKEQIDAGKDRPPSTNAGRRCSQRAEAGDGRDKRQKTNANSGGRS